MEGRSIVVEPVSSKVGKILLRMRIQKNEEKRLIVDSFVQADASIDLVIDETLERNFGPKMGS